MNIPKYFEDPKTLHVGCEENRSYYVPFSSGEENGVSALQMGQIVSMDRETSDRFQLPEVLTS